MTRRHEIIYTVLILLSAVTSQLGIMLAEGSLPVPKEWLPFMPLLNAALMALSTRLPVWRKRPRRG